MGFIETDDINTDEERLRVGQRVECRQEGSFKGQKGRIEDIFSGYAKVRLRTCTIMEPLTAFERV